MNISEAITKENMNLYIKDFLIKYRVNEIDEKKVLNFINIYINNYYNEETEDYQLNYELLFLSTPYIYYRYIQYYLYILYLFLSLFYLYQKVFKNDILCPVFFHHNNSQKS